MEIPSDKIKNDTDFLFEVGTLKDVSRGWNFLVNKNMQNVSVHTFRVVWVSYVLAHYYPKADLERVLKIALSYNIYRTRVGDSHYVSLLNVITNKDKAINDIFTDNSLSNVCKPAIYDYIEKKSLESAIVHVANGLENILELKELSAEGIKVADTWLKLNYKSFSNYYKKYSLDKSELFLEAIQKLEPYHWHLIIQNSFDFERKEVSLNRIEKELHFLYEIGTAKFLKRSWQQFAGVKFSNVAEHTFRTMWISWILALHTPKINLEKVLTMACVHDLDEIRSFDLNYLQTQYVNLNKRKSISGTLDWLVYKDKLLKLYDEYERQENREAKLVKDADSLEAILELKEKAALGVSVADEWLNLNKTRLFGKLSYEYSSLLLEHVLKIDSNRWHLQADNRFLHDW